VADKIRRIATSLKPKAAVEILGSENTRSDDGPVTIRAVERLGAGRP